MASIIEQHRRRAERQERAKEKLAELKRADVTRGEIRPVKKLDKKLKLNKMASDKLHHRAIRRALYGVIIGGAYAYTPVRELYYDGLSALGDMASALPDEYSVPATFALNLAGAVLVPAISVYYLGSAAVSQIKAGRELEREGHMQGEALIRRGVINKEKHLNRGTRYMKKHFEAGALSREEAEEVVKAHAELHAQDRAEYGRHLPKAVYGKEADSIYRHVLYLKRRKAQGTQADSQQTAPTYSFDAQYKDDLSAEPIIVPADETEEFIKRAKSSAETRVRE